MIKAIFLALLFSINSYAMGSCISKEASNFKDTRTHVKDANHFPWRTYGLLKVTFPAKGGRTAQTVAGTAVLVGKNHILTAAHLLYDPAEGYGFAESAQFFPGANGNLEKTPIANASFFIMHPDFQSAYDNKKNSSLFVFFDIAMVVLNPPYRWKLE